MKYLVDTDICIYVINERPRKVIERFQQAPVGDVAVSSITVAELAFAAHATIDARVPH